MPPSPEWPWRSLADAARAIEKRDVSPVELTRACVDRIERVDGVVHAFASVDAAGALHAAEAAEREIRAGRYRGPLHGVPVAIKDNYDTVGVPTRNGSRVFTDRMPSQDATAWVRLREAGAVMLGKTTMSEAAWGVDFPPVRNPWDVRRNPGLSSGGSRRRRGRRSLLHGDGIRHRRVDPDPRGPVRRGRAQGDLRARPALGCGDPHVVARSRRALDPPGRGLRRRARGDRRPRRARSRVGRGAGRRLPARSEARRPRPPDRRAP